MIEPTSFITEVLYLFFPILAANQAGMLGKVLSLPFSDVPVSRRWLGENKTLDVYCTGPMLGGTVYLLFYGDPEHSYVGILLGLGAVLGDHVKSFFKRLLGYSPGSPWWPDRIDFALGGSLVAIVIFPNATWWHVVAIVLLAWPVHYFGNKFSHKKGWRDTPW